MKENIKERIPITVNQIPCWKLTDEQDNCVEKFRTKQAAIAMKAHYQKIYGPLKIKSIGLTRLSVGERSVTTE